jgi:hypothetical protein
MSAYSRKRKRWEATIVDGRPRLSRWATPPYCYDVVPWTLYDSLDVVPGAVITYRNLMFSEPIGCDRSLVDTNMWMAQRLPSPNEFMLRRLWFFCSGGVDKNTLPELFRQAAFIFWLGRKNYCEGFLALYATGTSSLDKYIAFTNGEPRVVNTQRGNTKPSASYPQHGVTFDEVSGLYIPQAMNFHGEINLGSSIHVPAGVHGKIYFMLQGLLARGVQ